MDRKENYSIKSLKRSVLVFLIVVIGNTNLEASIPDSIRAVIEQTHATEELADLYLQLGDYWKNKEEDKAEVNYRIALELSTKSNNEILMASAQLGCGIILDRRHCLDSAAYFYNKSLECFRNNDLNIEQARVLNSIGILFMHKGDYSQAISSLEMGRNLLETNSDTLLQLMLSVNKSLVLKKIGDYKGALSIAQHALSLSKQLNDSLGMSKIQGNIGLLHQELGQPELAINYFFESLAIREKLGYSRGLAYPLHNLGLLYESLKEYDKSLDYYNKSLKIKEEFNDFKGKARTYNNIAIIYKCKGEYGLAKEYFNRSLKLKKQIGLYTGMPHTLNNLAKLKTELGAYGKSIGYHLQALDSSKVKVSKKELLIAHAGLYKNYKILGDRDSALYYLEKVNHLKHELLNESTSSEITKMEIRYRTKETELENKRLIEHETLMETTIRMQYLLASVLILCLVLVIVVAIVLFKKKKQKELCNIDLKQLNAVIVEKVAELEKVNDKLLQTTNLKEELTNMLVHDLKTPLNTIINASKITGDEQWLKLVEDSGHKMLNLVMNILDVYKYENTKMELHRTDIELSAILEDAINEVRFLSEQKQLIYNIGEELSCIVNVDKEIVRRVIVNILSNAVKFTPDKGRISIGISNEEQGYLKIWISNQGKAIPREMQLIIFDRFQQLNNADSRNIGSTGLGLTFCKLAIEAHDGNIGVVSEEGKDVKFWFTVPKFRQD